MIHPNMNISIIDIDAEKANICTIDEFYKRYIEHSEEINTDDCISRINFSWANIKITDWYGWTQLLSVEKVPVDKTKWMELRVGLKDIPIAESAIILSSETPVPSYNPYKSTKYFHGEIKYLFEVKTFESFSKEDYLRVLSLMPFNSKYSCKCRKLYGIINKNSTCSKCKTLVEYNDKNTQDFWHPISLKSIETDKNYGYRITSKSGFYNVNKFHLITNDDKKKHIK